MCLSIQGMSLLMPTWCEADDSLRRYLLYSMICSIINLVRLELVIHQFWALEARKSGREKRKQDRHTVSTIVLKIGVGLVS
jgi:hypothetical protein